MSQRGHELYEELISASLTGDLNRTEREQLDRHMAECAACRATMSAFAEQRRVVAGLRHVPVPRNLHARVRVGVERGAFATLPWWRRPALALAGIVGAAAVTAGALLAVVLVNQPDPPVAVSFSPEPSATILPSPTLTPSPTAAAPSPSSTPVPSSTLPPPPEVIGNGGVNFLALDGTQADRTLTLHGYDPTTDAEAELRPLNAEPGKEVHGPPVSVALSPDHDWLAYQTQSPGRGVNEIWVTHVEEGQTTSLGETVDDSPFSRRMTWSPDSRYLAYTAGAVDVGDGPDAFVFETTTEAVTSVTDTNATYAASFDPAVLEGGTTLLWVSVAGERPMSHLLPLRSDVEPTTLTDPGSAAVETVGGAFQPILAPNGAHALFWGGHIQRGDGELGWRPGQDAMLYLSGASVGGALSWDGEQAVFPSLPVDGDALASAQAKWSYDSNWFAVWQVRWNGAPQDDAGGGAFPREERVYFGQADSRALVEPDGSPPLALVDPESRERPWDVTFIGYEFGGEVPAVVVTIFEEAGGESGEAPVASSRLWMVPAAGFDGEPPELGDELSWAGPAFYVPQGDEEP